MLNQIKDQIRTIEQVNVAMTTYKFLKLNAIIIIGGIYYTIFLFIMDMLTQRYTP